MPSKNVVKPLSKMTKAELLKRARDLETMYNAEREKNRTSCSANDLVNLVDEKERLERGFAHLRQHVLGLEHSGLEMSQDRSVLRDLVGNYHSLLVFHQRDIERLMKVVSQLRQMVPHPISICPRCARVERSDVHESVVCASCEKALMGLKKSQQSCDTVSDTEV